MNPKICVICADRSEEIELLVPVDVWNRAGYEVSVYAYSNNKTITLSYSKLKLETLGMVNEIPSLMGFDAVFIPGGPGWRSFLNPETIENGDFNITKEINNFWENKKDGYLVSICGAPVALMKMLGSNGKHLKFTSHSSKENIGELENQWVNKKVEVSDRFITGQNAGCAFDLCFETIRRLSGEEKAKEIINKLSVKEQE